MGGQSSCSQETYLYLVLSCTDVYIPIGYEHFDVNRFLVGGLEHFSFSHIRAGIKIIVKGVYVESLYGAFAPDVFVDSAWKTIGDV